MLMPFSLLAPKCTERSVATLYVDFDVFRSTDSSTAVELFSLSLGLERDHPQTRRLSCNGLVEVAFDRILKVVDLIANEVSVNGECLTQSSNMIAEFAFINLPACSVSREC
jgi:hypothetical protein